MDPRTERTRAALRTAVLELAGERDVAGLTVADVTRRAGVHRATFYDHATSPADLLRETLEADLDAVRTTLLAAPGASDDPAAVVERAAHDLVAHTARFAPVYRSALESGAPAPRLAEPLRSLVADHLTRTLVALARAHPDRRPATVDPAAPDADAELLAHARYAALGSLGALEVWLALPEPRDPDFFPRVVVGALPAWWAAPSSTTRHHHHPAG